MSSEIEVTETPNWLQELEAKREKRLKARLGHEAGAGAPCLKCGEKCPGLDLHFWRKCCKICKCAKEEHEVQDDDIYGWAQFQLLGSKPNKIKRKIVLPGKKDEIELDWIPKGHNDTVDKYLKTLPPDQLPVKGSQAAQDRKQLLQKQIPIHDIDPTLCHELSNDELKQMNDYISHVKQTSVGVGQIVSLSNIIKANLHMLNPSEAALIASRYPKGIPLGEIVKLHSQSRASPLKHQSLNDKLNKLNLQDAANKTLPTFKPNSLSTTEENLNPWVTGNVRDVNYPGYAKDSDPSLTNAQFAARLKPNQAKNYLGNKPDQNILPPAPTLDEKFMQNPNFDPKNIPSQFLHQNAHYGQPYSYKLGQQTFPIDGSLEEMLRGAPEQPNSAFAPYTKLPTGYKPGDKYMEGRGAISPRPGEVPSQNMSEGPETSFVENLDPLDPNFAIKLAKYPSGVKKPLSDQVENFGTPGLSSGSGDGRYQSVEDMKKNNKQGLPNYLPGKYNVLSEKLSPTAIPKNVRDLAFTTYNPDDPNYGTIENAGQENYPQGYFNNNPYGVPIGRYPDYNEPGDNQNQNSGEERPRLPYETHPHSNPSSPYKQNNEYGTPSGKYPYGVSKEDKNDQNTIGPKSGQYGVYDPNSIGQKPGQYGGLHNQYGGPSDLYGVPVGDKSTPYDPNSIGQKPGQYGGLHNQYGGPSDPYGVPVGDKSRPYDPNSIGQKPGQYGRLYNQYEGPNDLYGVPLGDQSTLYDPNSIGHEPGLYREENNNPLAKTNSVPYPGKVPAQGANASYDYNNSSDPRSGQPVGPDGSPSKTVPYDPHQQYNTKPNKKLSELLPGKINIDEDYLQPSHVTIGAIQDINYPEIKAATQGTNDFYEDFSPENLREILNNVKLPDCHYCKKPFEENEFAVTIDRANVLFHAQCFKCAGCNQILADNVYFYNKETDNVYCGRDYAKVRGFPRCKACDELIFTKEYCLAENSTFHLKHFCCIECDKPLAGQDYTLEDEMPYCLPCFEHSKASKCSSCGRVIKPDEIGCNLNGVHFHAVDECFACKVCKKPLMGQKLLLRNEKLYCSHDCFGTDKK